jgi:BolA protein
MDNSISETGVAAQILRKVQSAFPPVHIGLDNESHLHAGPRTDSHFKLVLVSAAFDDLNKVRRHQAVYRLLSEELEGPVHALALHLYAPAEWQTIQVPASPKCANAR